MFCPYCGNPCAETHKFCFRCGKPLPEIAELPAVSEEPLPAEPLPEEVIPAPAEEPAEILTETAEAAAQVSETAVAEDTAAASAAPEQPVVTAPQPRKGRLWPPVLALIVMTCIGLAAFFLSPKAPEPVKSCFSIDNGVLYFDYSLYTGSDELTVPETVDGMAVTAISEGCFQDCDRLTTVILPESVTVIGENAFASCDALRGIYIPNGVLSVGAEAFAECPKLEAVCFPASIMEIGDGCLDNCVSLHYIFYDGTYDQWRKLYDGTYRTGVELHTNDGVYYAQP